MVINQLQLYKINLCESKRTKDMTFSLLLNKPILLYWSLPLERKLLPDLSYSIAGYKVIGQAFKLFSSSINPTYRVLCNQRE